MNTRSPITTHVLDTSLGRAASGIPVHLEVLHGPVWTSLAHATTNKDGRVEDFLKTDGPLAAGTYRLTFDTATYFKSGQQKNFYPSVTVTFETAQPGEHYHVPLLLSPFGYSTYRGT